MGEIAKTPLGRVRIANASERLDRTVAEMGEKHRVDVPRGRSWRSWMVYNNMMPLKKYSLNLFLYLPSPGWCSPLLMSQANAKLELKKLVTTLIGVSKAKADQ